MRIAALTVVASTYTAAPVHLSTAQRDLGSRVSELQGSEEQVLGASSGRLLVSVGIRYLLLFPEQ